MGINLTEKNIVKEIELLNAILNPNNYNHSSQKFQNNELVSFQPLKSLDELKERPELIKGYFFNKQRKAIAKENIIQWKSLVASPEEIINDFNRMEKNPLITESEETFNLRSIEGHSQEGHVTFKETKYPNTQLNNIFSEAVLYKIPHYTKLKAQSQNKNKSLRQIALEETQTMIDNYMNFMLNLFDVEQRSTIAPKDFFGIQLPKIPTRPIDAWKGFSFGASFDEYNKVRKPIEEETGLIIGGGSSELVDIKKIQELGINIKEFTSGEYKDPLLDLLFKIDSSNGSNYLLETLIEAEIVKKNIEIDYKVETWDKLKEQLPHTDSLGTYRQVFIRKKKGMGVSDNIACALAAFIEFDPQNRQNNFASYYWKIMSAHAADIFDTLTKETELYAPGGFDSVGKTFLNEQFVTKIRKNKWLRKKYETDWKRISRNKQKVKYSLVPLHEIKLLTAYSINPNIQNNHYLNEIYHSSAKNFLHKWEFPDDKTSTIELGIRFMYRKLEELGANVSDAPKKLTRSLYPKEVKIGFERIEFLEIIKYMNSIIPKVLVEGAYSRLKQR